MNGTKFAVVSGLVGSAVASLWCGARAAEPVGKNASAKPPIVRVQSVTPIPIHDLLKDSDRKVVPAQRELPDVPPTQPAPTQQTQPQQPTAAAPVTPVSASTPSAPSLGSAAGSTSGTGPSRDGAGALPQTSSNQVSGAESQTRATTDVGSLLGKSIGAAGVEVQRRNPIVTDPRVRGYRVGQLNTQADGATWIPARQDLDTIVSKLDSTSIRDVIVIKGPYSVRYGPGFSFIDVATFNTPRSDGGMQWNGRTNLGYQTNGARWDGRQAIWGGGEDWGVRLGWGLRQGNDYTAGGNLGFDIPSSYRSEDKDFNIGFDLTEDFRVEFRGLRLDQGEIEFPGLYFDVSRLITDAYGVRFIIDKQAYFDAFTFDMWYNRTSATGNTQQGAKQTFVNRFLSSIPGFVSAPGVDTTFAITDHSYTGFTQMSRGLRAAMTWGERDEPQLTMGTDLTAFNQHLLEIISFDRNPAFLPPINVDPFNGATNITQTLGVPQSNSVSPGLFADVNLPVTKRWNVKSGIRCDLQQSRSFNRFVASNASLTPFVPAGVLSVPPLANNQFGFDPIVFSVNPNDDNLVQNFDLWSTYVTTEYRLDKHVTLLGGFGFAQRPPTLTELYATGPFINVLQSGLNRTVGDPHLDQERLKQFDLGVKCNYDRFRGGASGFYAWINDYITYDLIQQTQFAPDLQPTFGDTNSLIVFTNTDLAVLAGGEIYAEYDATEYLTPFATVAYVAGDDLTHIDNKRPTLTSSRRVIAQEALPGIPPLMARTGFRFHDRNPQQRWSIEFASRLVDAQTRVASSLGEFPTPGFVTYDIRGFWRCSERAILTAGVENLTNKFYREHLDPRSGIFGVDQLFQPGLNFYFGCQMQY